MCFMQFPVTAEMLWSQEAFWQFSMLLATLISAATLRSLYPAKPPPSPVPMLGIPVAMPRHGCSGCCPHSWTHNLFWTIQLLKWQQMFGFRETSLAKQWMRKGKFLKCSSVTHITGIMEEHVWEHSKCLGSVCFLISAQMGISRFPCYRVIFKMGFTHMKVSFNLP